MEKHPAVRCQELFESKTADYYEGDFTKYKDSGEYVSPQQQDDFVFFMSGYQAAHEEAKALVSELVLASESIIETYGIDYGDTVFIRKARATLTKATKWLEQATQERK